MIKPPAAPVGLRGYFKYAYDKSFRRPFSKGRGGLGGGALSRDSNRGISPERAEQARSGIMRSEAQDGETGYRNLYMFGRAQWARQQLRVASTTSTKVRAQRGLPGEAPEAPRSSEKGAGKIPQGIVPVLPSVARQIKETPCK